MYLKHKGPFMRVIESNKNCSACIRTRILIHASMQAMCEAYKICMYVCTVEHAVSEDSILYAYKQNVSC
jgi:hypothetical protein